MKQLQIGTLIFVLITLMCSLPGCEQLSSSETNHTAVDNKFMSWRERYLQLGQDTYQDACAQCHDEGSGGAPTIGDQASWSDRSPLWSAVLIVHAQNGHLGMPAKGGCPELTEHQVAAAGEYMLSVTFPELPRD